MPFTLDRPIVPTDPDWMATEDSIQANIVRPHGRNFCQILTFTLDEGKPNLRKHLGQFAKKFVTSASGQRQQAANRASQPDSVLGCLYLTASAYRKLGDSPARFAPPSRGLFQKGLPNSSYDAILLLASSSQKALKSDAAAAGGVLQSFALPGPEESGEQIRDSAGNPLEHFGFRDGISQPDFSVIPAATILVTDPYGAGSNAFGTYIAYLKMRQDVDGFNQAIQDLAAAAQVTPQVAEAMVVGRFKDGTPLTLANQPDPALSSSPMHFEKDLGANPRCPFHSHIRKVRPGPRRVGGTDVSLTIARRGMTYENGPEKGLHFLSAQASLKNFRVILDDWMNRPNFPRLGTGTDALAGKNSSMQRWPGSHFGGVDANFDFGRHVTVEHGAILFAPSLSYFDQLA
jgi:deferrochelatase/peroxidase EfeB